MLISKVISILIGYNFIYETISKKKKTENSYIQKTTYRYTIQKLRNYTIKKSTYNSRSYVLLFA